MNAGRDDGRILATRGNGEVGYNITNCFDKGIIPVGGRGLGLGELVIVESYFEEHLSDEFEHHGNMIVPDSHIFRGLGDLSYSLNKLNK
ncbi:MAG: hypothetical protein MUO43_09515 [Desulfobacterales bacterium]|nr:hypothetical protein [Desulfobacterales bacterium]